MQRFAGETTVGVTALFLIATIIVILCGMLLAWVARLVLMGAAIVLGAFGIAAAFLGVV